MKKGFPLYALGIAIVALLVNFYLIQPVAVLPVEAQTTVSKPLLTTTKPVPTPKSNETWYAANQGTLGWDAPVKLANGTPIPEGSIIKYQVWRRVYSTSTAEKVGEEITDLQKTVTFSTEGSFLIGVQSIRYVDGVAVGTSEIAWSDGSEFCKDSKTFGFRSFLATLPPMGLRPIQ